MFISKVSLKQSIPLLKDAVFLDIEKPIGSSYDLRFNQQTDDPNSPIVYRNNYSLSMWIMVNNHSENKCDDLRSGQHHVMEKENERINKIVNKRQATKDE